MRAEDAGETATTSPAGLRPFAPGVQIDWAQRAVHVQTHVVLRQGALEFLACFAGREHESILRCDASAVHIYQALGLVGLEAGSPAPLDPETSRAVRRPTGALVEIALCWGAQDASEAKRGAVVAVDGPTAGTANACDWLEEVEYRRPPVARPWVFAGSQVLPGGALLADKSGAGVALVDFDDSLITLSRSYTSRNSALWVAARTRAIPPVGTPVTMIIRAAAQCMASGDGGRGSAPASVHVPARPLDVQLDGLAQAYVNGRWCSYPDLIDLLLLQRQFDPPCVTALRTEALLAADRAALRRALDAAGLQGAYRLD